MQKDTVYIIIINFGTPGHTIECLESIRENTQETFQAVIVDVSNINQSVSKISDWIQEKSDKRFLLLQQEKNNGFAFANNVGIKYALGQNNCGFLWILNNDTIIAKNCLEELIKCYFQNDKPGFIGAKILDYENRDVIQNLGGTFNKWTGYSVLIGMGEKDKGQFDNKDIKVDYVVGASMFFHPSLIEKTGLMPEEYFLYYEDIDWCITARKAGFTNLSCTNSRVYHKQGVSTGGKLLTNDTHLQNKKYLYLSYLTLYRRHFKYFLPIAYLILFKQLAGRIFHGQLSEGKLILQVIFSK